MFKQDGQRRSRIPWTLNVHKRVRLGSSLAAALLAILFEHPVGAFNQVSDGWTIRARADRLPALAGGEKLLLHSGTSKIRREDKSSPSGSSN